MRNFFWPLLAVFLIAWGVLASSDAKAQGGPRPPEAADALEFFVRGTEAAASGEPAAAARLFARSLSLVPRASTAFNLAITNRGLGRTIAAERVLLDSLAGRYGDVGELRPLMEGRLREVQSEIVKLHLNVSLETHTARRPPWVEVDGHRVQPNSENVVRLDAGQHVLRVGAEDYVTHEQTRAFALGEEVEVQVNLRLLREPGLLIIEANEENATIEIVGVSEGLGYLERSLQPGEYDLRVRGSAGIEERNVLLTSGDRMLLNIDVRRRRLSPWLVVGLSVAGLLIGASVVAGVVVARRAPEPMRSEVWGNTQVLQAPIP